MLEVKGLYKKYCPKKGQPVVALNRVSIKFPDTGLIFILGKSGSGKSTLLNVMGGLDKCDEGEIIIKGKSSKDFRQSDFDSYRNTYLGFIFQEYNILDEFNVGQNIALALELQGKKATTEEINKILEEVDLSGYGNRKPNELSGGQKQRVAIARALVKSPEIIFADEPTGALDSKTGIAVFDTLKKLSKDKLVIVVSHDREFAEQYGDRVIELADGNIISDIEKTKVMGNQVRNGITIIENKVIRIDKDYVLTPEDMDVIRDYLNQIQGERMISLDGHINDTVRHSARIDTEGNAESFIKTDESKITNKQDEFNSIHSRLSLRHCFRIGGSSLKVKPFRLVITILLSIVAFGMFGLSDTMGSYDKVTATLSSMRDEKLSSFALTKNIYTQYSGWSTTQERNATDEDIQTIKDQYGLDAKGVYGGSFGLTCFTDKQEYSNYYVTRISGFMDSSLQELQNLGFDLYAGTYPENINEVLISKHVYESFEQYGYRDYKNDITIEPKNMSPTALIGNNIYSTVNNTNTKLKITGILDTHFDGSRYERLKTSVNDMDLGYYMLANQYQADYNYGYHGLLFTNNQTIQSLTKNKNYYPYGGMETTLDGTYVSVNYLREYSGKENNVLLPDGKTSLDENESVYTLRMATEYYSENLQSFDEPITIPFADAPYEVSDYASFLQVMSTNRWVQDFAIEYYDEAIANGLNIYKIYEDVYGTPFDDSDGKTIGKEEGEFLYSTYLSTSYRYNDQTMTYLTSTTFADYYLDKINTYLKPHLRQILAHLPSLSLKMYHYSDAVSLDLQPAGLYLPIEEGEEWNSPLYVSEQFIETQDLDNGQYAYLICPVPGNVNLLENIVRDNYRTVTDSDPILYRIQTRITPSFSLINNIIETMAKVFFYIGIGFAVFASLMLFNFISVSISYKKREIGILRAVGARSKDVFNIFFAESFIISMIAYVFAILATFVVSMIINASLRSQANLVITILSPGFRQIGLVLLVCILVALISTFLPVYKIAMKKPIDAIRDR